MGSNLEKLDLVRPYVEICDKFQICDLSDHKKNKLLLLNFDYSENFDFVKIEV